jgi:trans-aconitate methyltransferase
LLVSQEDVPEAAIAAGLLKERERLQRIERILLASEQGTETFIFGSQFGGQRVVSLHGLLAGLSDNIDIWETEYLQVLEGENPVKEWTKGTWLLPLLAALDEPERSRFEAAYAERVAAAYPPRGDGKTLFPFRRLFLIAHTA